VLTDPDMKVKPRGKIYSINEGYTNNWDKAIQEYVASKKEVNKETTTSTDLNCKFNCIFCG
jgi:fructose-1,6-bisphosphatase I